MQAHVCVAVCYVLTHFCTIEVVRLLTGIDLNDVLLIYMHV